VPDVRTVVAVLTYRREELLPHLLAELAGHLDAVTPRAEVVVVDNDPAGSAAEVVGTWAGRGVRYVHEPRPGISAARNRALAEAAGADVLVFIDDDELPGPGWLAALVDSWRAWGCAAVAGPVAARLLSPPVPWVAGSGVFDRRRLRTGSTVGGAGSGNLLLDLRQVHALGLSFDERLGLTGGEDTLFTHQLVHRGGVIRWCDEAEAVELVPGDRLTRRWVLQRSFRSGSSWSRAEVLLAGGPARRWLTRAGVLARAAVRMPLAALALAGAVLRGGVAARARAVTTVAAYAGLVTGAFGYVLGEYARPAPDAPPSSGPRGQTRAAAR
jgi:glycosyltransferase involved in cell wall biosynthesis